MGKNYKKNYILGLDVGISSVGWGLLELDENSNPYRIIDVGSRIFTPGEIEKTGDSRAKERREKRGSRRVTRRREFRLDRVRNLLYEYGYLKGQVSSNLVSQKNLELTLIYNDMINDYYKTHYTNPYKLKVEALDRKLTSEELSIILVHYAKKRGYKSNREEASDNDSGKVLSAIKENEKIMKDNNYRTISEMYLNDEKFKDKIKNSPGNYKISVTNEMYLKEINMVLDSQIKFGTINSEFKEKYLEIYNSRRHYSDGPGYYYEYEEDGTRIQKRSPYGGNLIERMTGKCEFDKNPRAPKRAYSSELFVSLTKLLNLRYKSDTNKDYTGLTKEEINKILDVAKNKNKVTYKDLVKLLNQTNIRFKDLKISKKSYVKVINELKSKLNIPKEKKVEINSLSLEEKKLYNELYENELFNTALIELKGYHELRVAFEKAFDKEYWNNVKDNINLLDELALFSTNYKLNEEIKSSILNSDNIPNELADDNFIALLPNFKDHLMLSTEIIRDLIPLMLEGNRYDEAMTKLGYSHSDLNSTKEKKDLLVPIMVDENITNQRVIRSLTQTRKVLNAIIKKYGLPKQINIETARELAKSRKERNEIEKSQLERRVENDKIKEQLVELGLFPSVDRIKSTDLLKYKLWKEQNEFCSYSLKKITLDDLFANNTVQIDHILPYSRTYNDNYLNKTLVFTKENQDKKDKTPYEWFGKTSKWNDYVNFINNLNIPNAKKDNYLLENLDFDTEREMREQNLNDTKYISRELASLIKAYLNVEKVNVYPGAITAKLRAKWGFSRLTHSYISPNYILPEEMKKGINKDRDNHLHHAIDALVIASITPSLQQKITTYEKFSRYIDGLTEKEIKNLDPEYAKNLTSIYYDNETGEVIESKNLRDYIYEQISKENIYFNKHNIAKLTFPLPYDNFAIEAKTRVYERDPEILRWNLSNLHTYTDRELNEARVLTPSIAKSKISGAMHEETYYGIKENGENKYKTIRKPIEKITLKDLESIPDKEGGSKDIYQTVLEWLGNCQNGADALKLHDGKYPVNPNDKEQKEIKKLKVYTEYKNNGHMINKSNVEKGSVFRIEVYKSKDVTDGKLYFVAYDLFEIKNKERYEKNSNFDFEVNVFIKHSNPEIISYSRLTNEFNLINVFNKNDLVKISTFNDKETIAYIVGFSGGQLEVKSKIGDGYDIIGKNNIFNNLNTRYFITVSTIKSIKKLSISILGEISGL